MKMRKETTVAIVIGLILALLVTGGILRARHALQSMKLGTRNQSTSSPSPKPDPKSEGLFLDITTPDNTVSSTPTLSLTGKTLAGSYIAILGEKGEYLIVPNDLGSFSQDVTLIKGANTISVTVYQSNGKKVSKTINVVYTTAEL